MLLIQYQSAAKMISWHATVNSELSSYFSLILGCQFSAAVLLTNRYATVNSKKGGHCGLVGALPREMMPFQGNNKTLMA